MPCLPLFDKNGKTTGWICGDFKEKLKCYKCGKPAKFLCDYRGGYKYHKGYRSKTGRICLAYETADLNTCDKPMCPKCANEVAPDTHMCDQHNNEISIAMTVKSERAFRKMVERLDK